jgi:hypothetical protein
LTDPKKTTVKNKPRRKNFFRTPIIGETLPNGRRFVSMRMKFLGFVLLTATAVLMTALVLIPVALRLFQQYHTDPERTDERLDSYVRDFAADVAEEKVASNGKHLSIWSSEDVALLYGESPDEGLQNPHKGILDTQNTPKGWAALMRPHFNIRPDGEIYHAANVVLTLSEADL